MLQESFIARSYRWIYEALCGCHPWLRPWHFQWLDGYYLYNDLKRLLPLMSGTVLDVGCGKKPYQSWFSAEKITSYVGVDVMPGPHVDIIIKSSERWSVADGCFDCVLCTQVLEHVEDLSHTISEIYRVLRPGGILVTSFPFLYNVHGVPWDFRRFTVYGAKRVFDSGWQVIECHGQGGIGSTLGILTLNWVEYTLNRRFATRLLKAPLLPFWLVVSLCVNAGGLLLDRIDSTDAFYNNVFLVARKIG